MRKQQRTPGTFWELVYHSNTPNLRHVEGHDIDYEQFNPFQLMQGQRFEGRFPRSVRLWIEKGRGPLADHLSNMLGWTIMSDRLVEFLWPMIGESVQVLSAPLYMRKNSDARISGYKVVNVVNVLDCVDIERSTPRFDEDGRLANFIDVCIDPKRTQGAHIFKYVIPPNEVDLGVICSYELVKSLEGKGFTGLAFIRCRSPEDPGEEE